MPDEVGRLVAKHASNGILVDANVLLLLLVGSLDRRLIETFKRTRQYTPDDFQVLDAFLGRFRRIVSTPHILAEAGNLGGQLNEPARSAFFRLLAVNLAKIHEEVVESRRISDAGEHVFPRIGLTDSLTLVAAARNFLILSDDLELVTQLHSAEADVVNFTHLRPLV